MTIQIPEPPAEPSKYWAALERTSPTAETAFEALKDARDDGSEFWSGRALMGPLGYGRWENFYGAIMRAQLAAENSEVPVGDHFREAAKMVDIGSGAQRSLPDVHLSRYGAYLVAMNGDPHKPEIAAAQHYFAIRTRQAEVIEQRVAAAVTSPEDRAIKRLAVLQAAKGLIDEHHLEAKARIQLAIGLGEAPELEPSTRPLYAQTYLEERGLSRRQIKAIGGVFGKRLKAAFLEAHGVVPKQYPLETGAGQIRNVNAYNEADRSLMDSVWDRFYAQKAI
jgi:hypothetical protein